MKNNEIKSKVLEMPNQEVTKERYFISREGLETSLYQVDDEDSAKNDYGIKSDEILSLSGEQISEIIEKTDKAGKRVCFGTLGNLNSVVIAEKRLGNNIKNLTIDTEIENTLKKLSKLTCEEREIIIEETGVGDYEVRTICEKVTEYAEKKKVSTVTVSSVFIFTKAAGSHIMAINLLRNLRRVGIHIYFKNDGLWTGKTIHDMDIGALSSLAMCEGIEEDKIETVKKTNTLF